MTGSDGSDPRRRSAQGVLLVPVAALVVAGGVLAATCSAWVRYIGLGMQVTGFALTAWGIGEVRRATEVLPGLLESVLAWARARRLRAAAWLRTAWARLTGRDRGRSVIVQGLPAVTTTSVGHGTVRTGPGGHRLDVLRRLDELDRVVTDLRQDLTEARNRHKREVASLRRALEEERRAREEADAQLRGDVNTLAGHTAGAEALLGVGLFIVGTTLATIPDGVCGLPDWLQGLAVLNALVVRG